MRVASLLQLFKSPQRYVSVGNGHVHREHGHGMEGQQSWNGALSVSGARRGKWLAVAALLLLELGAGIESISSSIDSDTTPRFLEIPSIPPSPPERPLKPIASIPTRYATTELFKTIISALLLLVFERRTFNGANFGYMAKRFSPPSSRHNSEQRDTLRERSRSHSPSRAFASRHNRSTRSASVVNHTMMTRNSTAGARTVLWEADADSGRGRGRDGKLKETENGTGSMVMSELSPNARGRGREEGKDEGYEWMDDTERRFPSMFVLGTTRSFVALSVVASLVACRNYATLAVSKYMDSMNVHISSLFVAPIVAILLSSWLGYSLSLVQCQSMLMQICGVFLAEILRVPSNANETYVGFTLALTLLSAFSLVALEYVFRGHEAMSPFRIVTIYSVMSFALGLLATVIAFSLGATLDDFRSGFPQFHDLWLIVLHASVDVSAALLIFYYDAIVVCLTTMASTALLLLYTQWHLQSLSHVELGGGALAVMAFFVYIADHQGPFEGRKSNRLRIALGSVVFLVASLYAAASVLYTVHTPLPPSPIPTTPSIFADFTFIPPSPSRRPECTREELPSYNFYPGNRTYHEFDDVLLIVFFSHARYDVNLDYYKEVYSEFFPNMVFIGPGSREDLGFAHSYDVIVDSYQAEEDLSDPSYYKMSGRMAHHMLYTVLRDPKYSCYAGYLWAPFDTLLNVPRLQRFDQNRVWYHSPYAEFVPNPAVNITELLASGNHTSESPDSALQNDNGVVVAEQGKRPSAETLEEVAEEVGGAAGNSSKSLEWRFHAPPLMISPDPSVNWTATYKGWWVDWWWGEPHMGLSVCMRAFRQVPREQRARLSALTNGTRLFGGSADTLYIPRRLHASFLETLGLFLETDCFLEIAVPTAVHLVLEEGEKIQFVDHWWIFRPPFNATFVRDKWEHGFEVDTFHTFHWGDKGDDGVWRGNRKHIADVRLLLEQSAERQRVNLTTGEILS